MTFEMPAFLTSFGTDVGHAIEANKNLFDRNYATVAMQFHINRVFDLCFEDSSGLLDGTEIERVKIGYRRIRIEDEWGERIDAIDGTAEFFGLDLDDNNEEQGEILENLLSMIQEGYPFAADLDIVRADWLDPINERWPDGFGAGDKEAIFRLCLGDEIYVLYEATKLKQGTPNLTEVRSPRGSP